MPVTLNDDLVWFDSQTKLQQICHAVADARTPNTSVVLLGHFESTILSLTNQLRILNVGFARSARFDSVCGAGGQVLVGLARAFEPKASLASHGKATNVEIIVGEHHPLRSRDEQIIDNANKLTCDGQLSFHFSLDDPLMKYFGSTSIQDLMVRLGMPRDESISHPLVSNAIRSAQEKIETLAPKDLSTQSIEDWFKYNLVD